MQKMILLILLDYACRDLGLLIEERLIIRKKSQAERWQMVAYWKEEDIDRDCTSGVNAHAYNIERTKKRKCDKSRAV